jgi:hypothetical protein
MNEKENQKRPPCVRQCGPEYEIYMEIVMELPCKFLKALGACKSDGDLCEKDWLIKPSNYRRAKLMSFRAAFRNSLMSERGSIRYRSCSTGPRLFSCYY